MSTIRAECVEKRFMLQLLQVKGGARSSASNYKINTNVAFEGCRSASEKHHQSQLSSYKEVEQEKVSELPERS